jgi:hypothetical protein
MERGLIKYWNQELYYSNNFQVGPESDRNFNGGMQVAYICQSHIIECHFYSGGFMLGFLFVKAKEISI